MWASRSEGAVLDKKPMDSPASGEQVRIRPLDPFPGHVDYSVNRLDFDNYVPFCPVVHVFIFFLPFLGWSVEGFGSVGKFGWVTA